MIIPSRPHGRPIIRPGTASRYQRAASLIARVGLVTILAGLLPSAVASAQPSTRFDGIRRSIQRWMDSTGAPSLAVAVAKDGRIVWEEAFGLANRETMTPATVNTMYSLASISKPITATGLMILAERGAIDIDRPVNDYLGVGKITGRAGNANGATVARVLSHTAGLPLHYQFFYDGSGYGPPTMDETIARYANLVFAPGEVYQYSNLGFGIIDYLVARGSGRSYPDFMRADVFLPLGMTHTSIDIGPGLAPFAAERYDGQQRPIPFYTFDHPGASAVYSSAHDLIRFGMFYLKNRLPEQRRILTDRTIDRMHTAIAPAAYGLGWAITENDNGYRRVAHSGGMPGVATLLWLYPSENLAVTMLVNASIRPEPLAQDLIASMLPRFADSLRAARARSAPPEPAPFRPSPALVGSWRGLVHTWQDTVAIRLEIKADGDIHVKLGNGYWSLLDRAAFRDGRLFGGMWGRLPTDDVARHHHVMALDLRLVDGMLKGMASAQTPGEPVVYYSLASYVELRKE